MTIQEELVEAMGRVLTRRRFLAKLAGSILGMARSLIPLFAQEAYAYTYGCCQLCQPPSSTPCPSGCPSSISAGRWCWYCTDSTGFAYLCCECLVKDAPCQPNCQYAYGSYVVFYGRTSLDA